MIGTGLTYTEIGGIIATLFLVMFAIVIVSRFIMAFNYYIYNGDFGDGEKSAFVSLTEAKWSNLIKYTFTGYHPGMIFVDGLLLAFFSIIMIGVWGPMIILALFLLLGNVMRKRIAVKQTFVGNLKGDQLDEQEND